MKENLADFDPLRRRGKWWDRHSNSWRRVFFNTAVFSSPRPGGLSLQNFANINYIVKMLAGFGDHLIRKGIELEEDEFIIQVPYAAQKNELCRQIHMRCKADIANWVVVKTIDSNQGGQSTLPWICLTPANQHHGSQVGFLDRWNRLNVALTRAKAGVAIFGNIDRWFLEFEVFCGREKLRNWALLMADLMVKSDIVDIYKIQGGKMKDIYATCLPAVGRELRSTQFWSKMQQHCPEVALSKESQKFAENSNEQTRTQAFNDAVAKLASLKDSALESLKLIRKAPEIDAEESQEAATMEQS